ncbi:unnamed protein product, partial [Effrenium voratum]
KQDFGSAEIFEQLLRRMVPFAEAGSVASASLRRGRRGGSMRCSTSRMLGHSCRWVSMAYGNTGAVARRAAGRFVMGQLDGLVGGHFLPDMSQAPDDCSITSYAAYADKDMRVGKQS